MPVMIDERSVAANTTIANVFAGSAFEFARGRGVASFGVAGSATGFIDTIQAGADIIAEPFAAPILTRYPIIPDEMYFSDVIEVGDRIVVRAQNTTAGALTHRSVCQLSFGG